MKKKFLNMCVGLINTNTKIYDEKDLDKIRYGLEGIYLSITKAIILITISSLLGILKEFLIIVLLFNIIRYFSFGLHLNSSLLCLIASGISFIGCAYISKFVTIPILIKFILQIIFILIIFLYAPADTVKRPIISKRKRKLLKICSTLIALTFGSISLFINNNFISNALLLALFLEVLMILPASYKILGYSYNNYKKYQTKSGLK